MAKSRQDNYDYDISEGEPEPPVRLPAVVHVACWMFVVLAPLSFLIWLLTQPLVLPVRR